MAFKFPWNESEPTKNTPARDLDIVIRDFKKAIRERLEVEHHIVEDETGIPIIGEHKTGSARLVYGTLDERPEPNEDNPGLIYIVTDADPANLITFDTGEEWQDAGAIPPEPESEPDDEPVKVIHFTGRPTKSSLSSDHATSLGTLSVFLPTGSTLYLYEASWTCPENHTITVGNWYSFGPNGSIMSEVILTHGNGHNYSLVFQIVNDSSSTSNIESVCVQAELHIR